MNDMLLDKPTKVAPSPLVIKRLNNTARKHDFNRVLEARFIRMLDPEGVSLIKPILRHYHKHGEPTEDMHFRCIIYAKVRGRDEAVQVQLDLTPEDYEQLLTVEQYQDLASKTANDIINGE